MGLPGQWNILGECRESSRQAREELSTGGIPLPLSSSHTYHPTILADWQLKPC